VTGPGIEGAVAAAAPLTGSDGAAAAAAPGRRVCAHADGGGPAHLLEPGETCRTWPQAAGEIAQRTADVLEAELGPEISTGPAAAEEPAADIIRCQLGHADCPEAGHFEAARCVFCGHDGPLMPHHGGDWVCADGAACLGRGHQGTPVLISEVGTLTPEEMATLTVARDRVARDHVVLPPVSVQLVARLVAIIDRLAGITASRGVL
jgi:hypothetical protein